jgi:hypothetical protein
MERVLGFWIVGIEELLRCRSFRQLFNHSGREQNTPHCVELGMDSWNAEK